MIFDDMSIENFGDNKRTKCDQSLKHSEMEFELSLDNVVTQRSGRLYNFDPSKIYELYKVEFNTHWFEIKPRKTHITSISEFSSKDNDKEDKSEYWLKIKSDHSSRIGFSINLSSQCSIGEASRNLKAMSQESISFDSSSEPDESEDQRFSGDDKQMSSSNKLSQKCSVVKTKPMSKNDRFNNLSNILRTQSKFKTIKKKNKHISSTDKVANNYSSIDLVDFGVFGNKDVYKNKTFCDMANNNQNRSDDEPLGLSSLISLENFDDFNNNNDKSSHITCLMCKKDFCFKQSIAKIILCGHVFHQNCIDGHIELCQKENKVVPCPKCNKQLN